MKKYFMSFILALILIAILILIPKIKATILKTYKSEQQEVQIDEKPSPTNNSMEKDACCQELTSGNYSDASLYQLDCVWKNQLGQEVKLDNFLGKKVILAMIYTNCPSACPLIVNEMQRIQDGITKNALNNYKFVLVSIDPLTDTPDQLKNYANARNLNSNNWTLLTGTKYQIAELAQMIGFRYKQSKAGNFVHSNLITFLNKKGEIQNQSEGLNQDIEMLSSMLKD